MNTDETKPTAPVHAVVIRRLLNENGEPFHVEVEVDNPGRFVRGLWGAVSGESHGNPMDDDDACGEWTDRCRDYRTRVRGKTVYIYTHAWHQSGDRRILDGGVLSYLRNVAGLDV